VRSPASAAFTALSAVSVMSRIFIQKSKKEPALTAVTLLAGASLGAALVSAWFVGPLEPATRSLGLSQTFTGLVVVAIALWLGACGYEHRPIGPDRPLSDYGLDSLGNLELRTRIETETGVRIQPTHITTVRGLADHRCEQLETKEALANS